MLDVIKFNSIKILDKYCYYDDELGRNAREYYLRVPKELLRSGIECDRALLIVNVDTKVIKMCPQVRCVSDSYITLESESYIEDRWIGSMPYVLEAIIVYSMTTNVGEYIPVSVSKARTFSSITNEYGNNHSTSRYLYTGDLCSDGNGSYIDTDGGWLMRNKTKSVCDSDNICFIFKEYSEDMYNVYATNSNNIGSSVICMRANKSAANALVANEITV